MKYWHWIVLVVVIFVCLNVYSSQALKGVPGVGGYLSS